MLEHVSTRPRRAVPASAADRNRRSQQPARSVRCRRTAASRFVMTRAAVVLVCALELLGRSGASLPRIELIRAPSVVDENVEAFVVAGDQTIWIITTSEIFKAAARSACRDNQAVAKVA